jgi:hypothetical protein
MPNGIRLGVAADTREFDRGIKKGIIDPLDDASDALRDLAKDGDRAGSDLEGTFRDQQDATKKFERDIKSMGDTIRTTSKGAGRDLDKGIGDGLDKAGEGLGNFKEEAQNEAREAASSFSGEFSDVGDLVQSTLANALGGFGPIGAAAGIAAAVGFGALTAAISADAEKNEERVNSMYQKMLESQGRYLEESVILSGVSEIQEDAAQLADAQKIATESGESLAVVLRALAGDVDALSEVNGALSDKQDALTKSMEDTADSSGIVTLETDKQAAAISGAQDTLSKYTDVIDDASDKYNVYAEAARYANTETQQLAVEAARAAGIIRDIPSGKVIKITADTSTFVSDVRYAIDKAGKVAKGGINVPVRATNSTGRVVY